MEHLMAIRTNGSQVFIGIYFIPLADQRERREVMNVNESGPNHSIDPLKIEAANTARGTKELNAALSSST